jgi:hypothetical protein
MVMMIPSSASQLIHSLRKHFTALIVRNFASENLGKTHLEKHYLVVLPRSMDRNDTVADSLVALWTAIYENIKGVPIIGYIVHLHSAVSNFDPLRLQKHQSSCNLIVARFVDLTNDTGVKDWHSKCFNQECPNILSRNKWGKKLYSFYGIKSRAVAADEVQSWLK